MASVYFCLTHIVNLNFFFGVLPFRITTIEGDPKLQLKARDLIYSIVFCCILTTFFQLGVIELIHMNSWNELELVAFLAAFGQIYGLFFVALVAMITGWFNRRRTATVIQRIHSVDQRLSDMDIGLNYTSARTKLILQLIGLSVVPLGASMVNCYVINQKTSYSSLCYHFICLFPILVITLKEFQYYNAVLLIRKKLQIINYHLKEMGKISPQELDPVQEAETSMGISAVQIHPITIKFNSLESDLHVLQNLTKIHSELMDILKEIQVIFGPHLLTSILTAFCVITTQLYYLFTGIVHELKYNIFMICMTTIWVAIQVLLILVNVVVCSKTKDTVREQLIYS